MRIRGMWGGVVGFFSNFQLFVRSVYNCLAALSNRQQQLNADNMKLAIRVDQLEKALASLSEFYSLHAKRNSHSKMQ